MLGYSGPPADNRGAEGEEYADPVQGGGGTHRGLHLGLQDLLLHLSVRGGTRPAQRQSSSWPGHAWRVLDTRAGELPLSPLQPGTEQPAPHLVHLPREEVRSCRSLLQDDQTRND